MSSRTLRNLTRFLTLVPTATFVLHIGAAHADDAQQLAQRAVLGSGAPAVSVASRAQRSLSEAVQARDAQELARWLLLGAPRGSLGAPEAVGPKVSGPRGHGDAQLLAQQVLHGHRGATTGS